MLNRDLSEDDTGWERDDTSTARGKCKHNVAHFLVFEGT